VTSGLAVAAVLLLVLVNACFVAAEYAIVTVRRTRIEALCRAGSRRARILQRVVDDLDRHISAIQLAITSVGIAIGWLGEPAIAEAIGSTFSELGVHSALVIHSTSFVIAFALITSVVVVGGELAPKFLGLRRTERVALWMAPPLRAFAGTVRPLLAVLNGTAGLLLKLVGVTRADPDYERMNREEMSIFLSKQSMLGRLSPTRRQLLENVLDFTEHTACDVMIPRDSIDYLSLERPWDENLAVAMETEHTRYPLCESGLDSVIGMIHIKDLFHRAATIQSSEDLRLIQHEMLFVPESQSIDELQRTFQAKHTHMGMVLDEYGVPTGLVTMEDILEELVGEIQDEFDEDEAPKIVESGEGLLVDGMLRVDELRRDLELEVEEVEADTLGGYVNNALGKIARVGDHFKLGTYDGRVVEMQGRRVARVLLTPAEQRDASGRAAESA
jgi:CBS domain containing-hemolysin-like protein